MEDDLHPHPQDFSQLSCEVVFIVLVLHLWQLLLPKKRHAANLKQIGPRGEGFPLAQVQVADSVPLVDLEIAFVVPLVDAVAHVVAEGGQGRGELQDVSAVAQVAEVQVELEGVFDVHAGQADLLLCQLQETGGSRICQSHTVLPYFKNENEDNIVYYFSLSHNPSVQFNSNNFISARGAIQFKQL